MDTCRDVLRGAIACSGEPQRVDTALRFVTLAASLGHGTTCGLTASGAAWCWGFGLGGQLGDGRRLNSITPVAVAGGQRFERLRLAPSAAGACGQTADGALHCWGPLGLLYGRGQSGEVHAEPVPVLPGMSFVDFDLGEQHACGVTAAGEAYCWGNNWYGQLGIGSAGGAGGVTQASTPQRVLGASSLRRVVTGSDMSCGLADNGTATCWGNGTHVGSAGAPIHAVTARAVDGGLRFVSLHAGFLHVCGLTAQGDAYCWGENAMGDLGDGTQQSRLTPVKVQAGVPFASLSQRASCALTSTGTVYCWGNNAYGQVGRPAHLGSRG
jgi:alpha-tubulin suppressor-like RCC1 family protein